MSAISAFTAMDTPVTTMQASQVRTLFSAIVTTYHCFHLCLKLFKGKHVASKIPAAVILTCYSLPLFWTSLNFILLFIFVPPFLQSNLMPSAASYLQHHQQASQPLPLSQAPHLSAQVPSSSNSSVVQVYSTLPPMAGGGNAEAHTLGLQPFQSVQVWVSDMRLQYRDPWCPSSRSFESVIGNTAVGSNSTHLLRR